MTQPATPFTFIDSICKNKRNIWNEETESAYIPYIINRHLSYFPDTVIYANQMNMVHDTLSPEQQYHYLRAGIAPRARFTKWKKQSAHSIEKLIARFFAISVSKAKEIHPLLSKAHIEQIELFYDETTKKVGKRRS